MPTSFNLACLLVRILHMFDEGHTGRNEGLELAEVVAVRDYF